MSIIKFFKRNMVEEKFALIYNTQRLILKTLDESDVTEVLNYFAINRDFLESLESKRPDDFYTFEYQQKFIKESRELKIKGEALRFWICKVEEPKRVIGNINFNNIIRDPFQSCFLGYRLDKDEINKGYMTEALSMAVKIAFEELKLHRIEANIMPGNVASLKVVQKLGFHNEGLAPKYLKINGAWEDHIHMVLINEDDN